MSDASIATTNVLAAGDIHVGEHSQITVAGMVYNFDTIYATLVAAVIVLALAFFLRAKVTSTGVPNGVQLFWEAITIQMRNQIESAIGMKIAPFVLPLAVTLFVFILVANWLSVLPVQYTIDGDTHDCSSRRPPTSTSCWRSRCSCSSATTRPASGAAASSATRSSCSKGHVALLAPINLVEEIAKPISLSLRLFGNIFAGGILVALIALFPPGSCGRPTRSGRASTCSSARSRRSSSRC